MTLICVIILSYGIVQIIKELFEEVYMPWFFSACYKKDVKKDNIS